MLIEYKIARNPPPVSIPGIYETLNDLPDNVWREVAIQLPFKDQRTLRRVSRRFEDIFENKGLLSGSETNVIESQAELRRIKNEDSSKDAVAKAELIERSATKQHRLEAWYIKHADHTSETSFSIMRSLMWPNDYSATPVMNWNGKRQYTSFWGMGDLNYFDSIKDYTAPLMRGFDETNRPFIAALVVVEHMTEPYVDEATKEFEASEPIDQIVFYQYSEQNLFYKPGSVSWRASLTGPNLTQLGAKLGSDARYDFKKSLKYRLRSTFLPGESPIKESINVLLSGKEFTEIDGTTLRLFRSMDEVKSHRERFRKQL